MLTLAGISKSYGDRVLFADATLQVNRQDRIGLVGPNGAGKSTLSSITARAIRTDEGASKSPVSASSPPGPAPAREGLQGFNQL
jgi:ATPase subunit of ABC transporter with duplicated ATPase domains